uniref:Periphilin 1 n=1 Tax=Scleropages formosus TaxID=113540 RepID=A0A8C9TKG0_SCLFO
MGQYPEYKQTSHNFSEVSAERKTCLCNRRVSLNCRLVLFTVAYRKERGYDDFFHPDRGGPYLRDPNERRPGFGRPNGEYFRNFDYDDIRYSNGGPRSYHNDDHRGYHGDSGHFMTQRRSGPPRREDGFLHCREPRDEPYGGRHGDFRTHLNMQHLGLLFRDHRDGFRRKPMFPPHRERSPFRKDVPPSPHSRSGSSLSSRSYSPERSKSYSCQNQQRKISHGLDGNFLFRTSPPQEEVRQQEVEQEAPLAAEDEDARIKSDFHERRSQAIATKAREIEKVYRQDCETFGMVVKMLVAKDPSLEKQLQNPLRENLCEIRERCLEDLKHFISELDEVVLHSEALQ